jgi:hypothetical protein
MFSSCNDSVPAYENLSYISGPHSLTRSHDAVAHEERQPHPLYSGHPLGRPTTIVRMQELAMLAGSHDAVTDKEHRSDPRLP